MADDTDVNLIIFSSDSEASVSASSWNSIEKADGDEDSYVVISTIPELAESLLKQSRDYEAHLDKIIDAVSIRADNCNALETDVELFELISATANAIDHLHKKKLALVQSIPGNVLEKLERNSKSVQAVDDNLDERKAENVKTTCTPVNISPPPPPPLPTFTPPPPPPPPPPSLFSSPTSVFLKRKASASPEENKSTLKRGLVPSPDQLKDRLRQLRKVPREKESANNAHPVPPEEENPVPLRNLPKFSTTPRAVRLSRRNSMPPEVFSELQRAHDKIQKKRMSQGMDSLSEAFHSLNQSGSENGIRENLQDTVYYSIQLIREDMYEDLEQPPRPPLDNTIQEETSGLRDIWAKVEDPQHDTIDHRDLDCDSETTTTSSESPSGSPQLELMPSSPRSFADSPEHLGETKQYTIATISFQNYNLIRECTTHLDVSIVSPLLFEIKQFDINTLRKV